MNSLKWLCLGLLFISQIACTMEDPLEDFGIETIHEREIDAIRSKWKGLSGLLQARKLKSNNLELFICVFKQEEVLELWVKPSDASQYDLFKSYSFCVNSGDVGPKRREGDRQIPEGIYHIEGLNPKSQFLLSLRINYPNPSDLQFADPERPGSDIYIHGACSSVGCISLSNAAIQELYIMVLKAQQHQSAIPVYFFPCRDFKKLEANRSDDTKQLWAKLETILDYFNRTKQLPQLELKDGYYQLK